MDLELCRKVRVGLVVGNKENENKEIAYTLDLWYNVFSCGISISVMYKTNIVPDTFELLRWTLNSRGHYTIVCHGKEMLGICEDAGNVFLFWFCLLWLWLSEIMPSGPFENWNWNNSHMQWMSYSIGPYDTYKFYPSLKRNWDSVNN